MAGSKKSATVEGYDSQAADYLKLLENQEYFAPHNRPAQGWPGYDYPSEPVDYRMDYVRQAYEKAIEQMGQMLAGLAWGELVRLVAKGIWIGIRDQLLICGLAGLVTGLFGLAALGPEAALPAASLGAGAACLCFNVGAVAMIFVLNPKLLGAIWPTLSSAARGLANGTKRAYNANGNPHEIDLAAQEIRPALGILAIIATLVILMVVAKKGSAALSKLSPKVKPLLERNKLIQAFSDKARNSASILKELGQYEVRGVKYELKAWVIGDSTKLVTVSGVPQKWLDHIADWCRKNRGWVALRQRSPAVLKYIHQGKDYATKKVAVKWKTIKTPGRSEGLIVVPKKLAGANDHDVLLKLLKQERYGVQLGERGKVLRYADLKDLSRDELLRLWQKVPEDQLFLVDSAGRKIYSDIDWFMVTRDGKLVPHEEVQTVEGCLEFHAYWYPDAGDVQHGWHGPTQNLDITITKKPKAAYWEPPLDEHFVVCSPDGDWMLLNYDQMRGLSELLGVGWDWNPVTAQKTATWWWQQY